MNLTIREVHLGDGAEVSRLLALLGYPAPPEAVEERVARLAASGSDPTFVAEMDGRIVGLVALHVTQLLHLANPVARITGLVVEETARRAGIGRRLTDHAVGVAREAGCAQIELTTGIRRSDAHSFYEALGFERTSYRYALKL